MTTKKDLIIAVLATFCLASTLFSVLPTRSSPAKEYDPWVDVNCDGVINMRDIGIVCDLFMATGVPINGTQLLENITKLQAKVEELETEITYLNSTIVHLNETVIYLNNTLVLVWDSGWYGPTLVGDTVFNFDVNLNVEDAVVYMVGKKTMGDDPHQIDYGGYVNGIWYYGAWWWNLTPTSITFHRHGNDVNWVYVRITIWQRISLP